MTAGKNIILLGIVVAAVIIAFLALREFQSTVDKYQDLTDGAQRATVRGYTSQVQAAVNVYYARKALEGEAVFPPAITADLFTDGQIPPTTVGEYYWEYDSATGKVSNNVD